MKFGEPGCERILVGMVSQHLAVLGSPIQHSKSPLIHAAAYESLGLDWDYGRYDLSIEQFVAFMNLRDASWRGFSVTMPLKEIAANYCSALSPTAAKTGIANTLLNAGSGWLGFNTDVFGIKHAISAAGLHSASKVAVVGSGATARSAALALHEAFPDAQLVVNARNEDKAAKMLSELAIPGDVAALNDLVASDITVSTLPKGTFVPASRQKGALLDVAYDPWPSKPSRDYDEAISGLEMLLWQALAQIRIFATGDEHMGLDNEAELLAIMRQRL